MPLHFCQQWVKQSMVVDMMECKSLPLDNSLFPKTAGIKHVQTEP